MQDDVENVFESVVLDNDEFVEVYYCGLVLEKVGDLDGVVEVFCMVLCLDLEDLGGVFIWFVVIGVSQFLVKMLDVYVVNLFDQYVDVFEDILVDEFGYCVLLLLQELFVCLNFGLFVWFLDLGCGIGLIGVVLVDRCGYLIGVDLFEWIVEFVYDCEVYDDFYVGEVVDFLNDFEDDDGVWFKWDLIVVIDVFFYLGVIELFL